jgi:glycerate-2-kinase
VRAVDADSVRKEFPAAAPKAVRDYSVLLSNDDVLDAASAAARRRGFTAEIAEEISDGPIESGCAGLFQHLSEIDQAAKTNLCLISGGEFSCPVRGDGIGGRNLETALRLACATNLSLPAAGNFVALCAGTDGIDGNSPAAGAIVDQTTIERAKGLGLDPLDFLNRSTTLIHFLSRSATLLLLVPREPTCVICASSCAVRHDSTKSCRYLTLGFARP